MEVPPRRAANPRRPGPRRSVRSAVVLDGLVRSGTARLVRDVFGVCSPACGASVASGRGRYISRNWQPSRAARRRDAGPTRDVTGEADAGVAGPGEAGLRRNKLGSGEERSPLGRVPRGGAESGSPLCI